MIFATLVAATLVLPAATEVTTAWPPAADHAGASLRHMSVQQKREVVRPLVNSANDCIARRVSSDPRFKAVVHASAVNDLIVESVPSCLEAVRSMIEAHDRLFGDGAGESFFMGPYLDALPGAVRDLVRGQIQPPQ
jgi:hypothetical protein